MIPADEEVIKVVLEKYCAWLNIWAREEAVEGHSHIDQPRQFTVYEPEQKLWGLSTVVARIDHYYPVFHLHVSDGDEGGPAILIAWMRFEEDERPTPIHITHEFDTNVATIYEETWTKEKGTHGAFLHTP